MYKTASINYQKSKNILLVKNFYNLMKPRVMSLVVFTALVGLVISKNQIDFVSSILALFFVAAGAGAAGALNMWYDSEIDAIMSRTCLRPIPLGKISNNQALYFGIFLTLVSVKNVNLGTQTTGDYVANIQGTTNEITVSPTSGEGATVTIGLPDDVTIANNLNIGGDLNVAGVINTVNSTQVNISDNKINLNSDMPEENAPSLNAGIVVHRGLEADAEILWNETVDRWQVGLQGGSYHEIARVWKSDITTTEVAPYTFTATHNLGTRDVLVAVYATSSPYSEVEVDVDHTSTNAVTLTFAIAPVAGAYRVVITG